MSRPWRLSSVARARTAKAFSSPMRSKAAMVASMTDLSYLGRARNLAAEAHGRKALPSRPPFAPLRRTRHEPTTFRDLPHDGLARRPHPPESLDPEPRWWAERMVGAVRDGARRARGRRLDRRAGHDGGDEQGRRSPARWPVRRSTPAPLRHPRRRLLRHRDRPLGQASLRQARCGRGSRRGAARPRRSGSPPRRTRRGRHLLCRRRGRSDGRRCDAGGARPRARL